MKRWYAGVMFFLALPLFTSLATAQQSDRTDNSFETRIDDATDDLESFIDSVVENVEYEVERIAESRQSKWTSDDEENDDDQDKKNSISDAVTFNGKTEINAGDSIQTDLVVKNGDLVV